MQLALNYRLAYKNRVRILGLVLGLLLAAGLFWFRGQFFAAADRLAWHAQSVWFDLDLGNKVAAVVKVKGEPAQAALPVKHLLNVPFTSQAPHANWDMPYQEACEEASVLMVDYYLRGKTFTPVVADKEILKVVEWQKKVFGDYWHTNVAQTVRMIKEVYGYKNVRVIENPSVDDIKKELVAGNPVLVPSAGRLLDNPYFKSPGPIYHMFVITGYSGRNFITNDPGTRRGKGFKYSFDDVMDSMHDWVGEDATVEQGKKAVIVVDKPAPSAAKKGVAPAAKK